MGKIGILKGERWGKAGKARDPRKGKIAPLKIGVNKKGIEECYCKR